MSRKNISADRLSRLVFYSILALTLLVFGGFFLVAWGGGNRLMTGVGGSSFTGLLIGFLFLMLLATTIVALWSVGRNIRNRRNLAEVGNHIPSTRIAWAVVAFVILLMAATFVLSSSKAIIVNGSEYSEWIWIKIAGMFILTTVILISIAFLIVIIGYYKAKRKQKTT